MAGPFRLRCRARVPPELPVLVRDLLLELLRRWNGLPGDPRQPLIDLGRQVGDEAVGEERRHDDAKHRVVDDPGRLVAAVRAALDAIGRIEAEEALVLADRTPEGWMLSPRRKASVPLTAASARTYCQGTKTPSRRARVSTLSSCWSSDLGFEFSSEPKVREADVCPDARNTSRLEDIRSLGSESPLEVVCQGRDRGGVGRRHGGGASQFRPEQGLRLSVSRRPCTQPQAQARRHVARHRERRQAARGRDARAYGRRERHRRLLRRDSRDPKAPRPRYVADCLGQADGEGRGRSFRSSARTAAATSG